MMELKKLQSGDYIKFEYGSHWLEFYVLTNYTEKSLLELTRRSWCVNDTITLAYQHIEKGGGYIYLGRGKKRWWRNFLPVLNAVISIYSSPKQWRQP